MKKYIIYALVVGFIANALLSYAEKAMLANMAKTQTTIEELK